MEGAPARLFMLEDAPASSQLLLPFPPLFPFPALESSSVRYHKVR